MKQTPTLFLKTVVFFVGIGALALCIYMLPIAINEEIVGGYRPILLGMLLTAIPFFNALTQAYKLLALVDVNQEFSVLSINALQKIKYSAAIISGLYTLGTPYIFLVAEQDDAPGVILIALIIIFTSLVIATFMAVLQKLIQNAVDIKSENDLTV